MSISLRLAVLALVGVSLFSACQSAEHPTPTPPADDAPYAPPPDALFELLPPESTGIDFVNNIIESHRMNIVTNSYMYNGGGVAVLDVNNDSLPDLYFTSSQESNRLYLNKGGFRFEDITESSGTGADGFKTGVTVVDINADGWQDLYVCRSGIDLSPEGLAERANLLFVNNGDGTFTERAAEYGLNDASASNHANFFDYDRDGDLDAYILNHPITFHEVNKVNVRQEGTRYVRNTAPRDQWESDKLFRNNGDGTFTDVSQEAGIQNRAFGLSVTVSDFNHDGWPDIFVGNDYIEPDLLYLNNQDGTFRIATDDFFRHTSNHTMGVDIADFNNDALVDLVALDMIAEDNRRQKELMTTMLLDRYLTLVKFGYGHQLMRNTLQLNNGRDFSEIGTLAGISNTDWSWAVLLLDFDNDARKDLFITNGYRRDVTNLDYLNYTVDSINRMGGLSPQTFPDINDYLRLIPAEKLPNYLFRNRGDLRFENVSRSWGIAHPSWSNGAAWADLDADGDPELIVNNIHQAAFVFRNRAVEQGRGHWLQIRLEGRKPNPAGIGARVRIQTADSLQYQELSPVRGFFSSVEHLLHFGLGEATRVDRLEVQWPDGSVQVLENLPADRRITLRQTDARPTSLPPEPAPEPLFEGASPPGLEFVHRENEFIDFNRERLLPHKLSTQGPRIAVGDVNGDGLEDFYIGGAVNQPGALFVQGRDGTFRQGSGNTWLADLAHEDVGALFFDADGDGDQDLYVVSGGNAFAAGSELYQDRLYLNDGQGTFAKNRQALPRMHTSGSCVSAHDFDQDGDLDLFVGGRVVPGAYPTAPESYVLRNEGGTFEDVTAEVAPELQKLGMITALEWGDVDGDGTEELLVAGEWLPISVFALKNGRLHNRTADFGLENSNGWWNALLAADLDGDGDLDLAAGNLGWNARLKASPEEPLQVFTADFDANGSIDPVLAYFNGGQLHPLPLRDLLIKQMPPLKKKFVRYGAYARATIYDVFPPEQLEQALHLEAKTFTTCWFENLGTGRFRMHALPVEAQFAPVYGILAQDFNADGRIDLLLVGNDRSFDVETGPIDASNGAVLLADGQGGFRFLPNRAAGFWADGEARDVAPLRLADGRLLLLVANNNGALQQFVLKGTLPSG